MSDDTSTKDAPAAKTAAAKKTTAKRAPAKRAASKGATAKRTPRKRAASKKSSSSRVKRTDSIDLATSGRTTAQAAEDRKGGKKVSKERQELADIATGGGGQGVHPVMQSVSSAALNPLFAGAQD